MDENQIRVRFAPSPSGYLHIGGARTALFNWLFARKTGGAFVLRIEDTDEERSTESSYRAILDALEWLGLDWDEGPRKGGAYGPYLQSSRQVLYHNDVQKLLDAGMAYRCYCTTEELQEMREDAAKAGEPPGYDGRCWKLPDDEVVERMEKKVPHVVRFKIPPGETKVYDLIRGPISFNNDTLDDFVLLRSNGKPTYNFAVTIDDARMRISHVIRGDDHISNTPKQILLYKALGYHVPKFAHVPMILGSDRSRLSKRHGAMSVQEFQRMGYLSDSMINYLALLGWSLDGKTEFFTRENLMKKFSLKRVSNKPAAYDLDKLNHIDGEHFKNLPPVKRISLVLGKLEEGGVLPPDFEVEHWNDNGKTHRNGSNNPFSAEVPRLAIILQVMGNRLRNLKDASELLAYFYKDDYTRDAEAYERFLSDADTKKRLSFLAERLGALEPFDRSTIENTVRAAAEELGIKAADLIHPCRVALTGKSVSPDLFSVIQLLGRDKCVERLALAAEDAGAAPTAAGSGT